MLILPIEKKWFDMIMSGEKLEEYREIKPYWEKRLNVDKTTLDSDNINNCKIRAGYNKHSPTAMLSYWLDIGSGNPNWGAEPDVNYYRLHIISKAMEDNKNVV